MGMAALSRMAMSGADLSALVNAAAHDPNDANMLMGLSIIFQLTGNREMGMQLQGKALGMRQLYHLAPASGRSEIRLLAILQPGDMLDNTPLDFLLEGSNVGLDLLYVSQELPFPTVLPEHDAIMVGIAQSDQSQSLLEKVGELVKSSPCPVLNSPERIARLARDSVSAMLGSVPGMEVPRTVRIGRQDLQQIRCEESSLSALSGEVAYPVIVRPINSHGGLGLARIAGDDDLGDYLDANPDQEFHVAPFVDYRSADGLYRKCRIALIGGQPFACHLAISEDWMIHYRNAGMSESETKRAEEERFMQDFDDDFGARYRQAFKAMDEILGLDYLVVDCAETQDGRLLVFEADNLGFVHALDPVDVFPYKQTQMRKVFGAFQSMLKNKVSGLKSGNDASPPDETSSAL